MMWALSKHTIIEYRMQAPIHIYMCGYLMKLPMFKLEVQFVKNVNLAFKK